MDFLVGAGTLASVVAAITGILNYRNALRSARRLRQDETAARWSVELSEFKTGGSIVTIHYNQSAPPIRIIALRARSPRGLLLQTYSVRSEKIEGTRNLSTHVVPDSEGPRSEIKLYRDSNDRTIGGGTFSALYYLPSPPRAWSQLWILRKTSTRLRISARYEDRTANRRISTIELISAQIPWTSEQTVAKAE